MKDFTVFRYTDVYRYIRDCQTTRLYPWAESYRNIARELGTGGSYFWLVVHGKKPFPRSIIEGLPVLMSLSQKQSAYFQLLMHLSNLDMDENFRIGILNKFRPARYTGAARKSTPLSKRRGERK